MTYKASHLLLLKTLYAPYADETSRKMVANAVNFMSETEQVAFADFQHRVGNLFVELQAELDQGLTDLADQFPEETDPRKWDDGDWANFYGAVNGHRFEELYTTYAEQKPNIDLVWKVLEARL